MIRNRIYYTIKPILPQRVRAGFRRATVNSIRRESASTWPIDELAGVAPPNWPGWPDGKRFAFILTHDVEGPKGLDRIPRLMDLEVRHGFRSSFNLVPEGQYRVTDSHLNAISQAGFEVGVHGLHHDGKLYNSKATFERRAERINHYLREWKSCGFRSPLMQHRLEWLHRLNIEYDCSTFDTDPFEPQPDGYRTIFPFWVPGPNGSGYVELPYSLPQDFSTFIVLREPNNQIWKRKLDWIAAHGGMALINTHPDYMAFDGNPGPTEFPLPFYEEFLRYVREKYEGQFWTATPRDVARYYCSRLPVAQRNTRRRVCMVVYSHYESDSRVRRYAESLARRGDCIDVVALGHRTDTVATPTLHGVTVHHRQYREPDERSKWDYAWRILRFFAAAARFLHHRQGRSRYDLVHVHNMPDFLAFTAIYPKWTGARVILDIHDMMPEMFTARFKQGGLYYKLLLQAEKQSCRFADHVIAANHLWFDTLVNRSVAKEKCTPFENNVDGAIFWPHPRTRDDDRFVMAFPGSFQWHQGLDIAIDATAIVRRRFPNVELHLYGSGRLEPDLRAQAGRLDLNGAVRFFAPVPLDRMPQIMAEADLGVVPKRADGFGNEAYSTKIMEFMSQGVPVIASRTKVDTYYFDDSVIRFFPSGDVQALADAMIELIGNKELRDTFGRRGREYAARNCWDVRKQEYFDLVDSLLVG